MKAVEEKSIIKSVESVLKDSASIRKLVESLVTEAIEEKEIKNFRMIVPDNIKEFGWAVNEHLKKIFKVKYDFIIEVKLPRFSNGEGKAILVESVRGKNVYILTDVGDYSTTYKIRGNDITMTPDEHWQDLKRLIAAARGNATSVNIIMPLLYESRQHRRNGRESLDCALALQELKNMGVYNIITLDAHDRNIQNAIPISPFDSFWPTKPLLEKFLTKETFDIENTLLISPDEGAMGRTRHYSSLLLMDIGLFYKRRDYSIIENGKNPVIEHKYLGKEQENLSYIIVDDMIASGSSVFDIIDQLQAKKPQNIYIMATFALFTEGIEKFDKYYKERKLTKVYTTNLSYIPNKIKESPWIEVIDESCLMAEIIATYIRHEAVSPILNGKNEQFEQTQALKEKMMERFIK